MTRLNTIDPALLPNVWLAAEYRELPRVLNHMYQFRDRAPEELPATYRMGSGHVNFFRNKGAWLYSRHLSLVAEMKHRARVAGRTFEPAIDCGPVYYALLAARHDLCSDWLPQADDHMTNFGRLCERWPQAKRPMVIGSKAMGTPQDAINWAATVALQHGLNPTAALECMLKSLHTAGILADIGDV